MKTKTIFKTLALAVLIPAMMLTTACSSSDDDAIINNENINNENTAKKGFTIPVTVNVTRQGDATTRATYNEGDKKLEFSAGDKLFVWDFGYSSAGYFAGTLNYVENSGGTFSGTIITQNEYSGTAETLLSQSDPNAVLLPNGYGTYGFLSIEGVGYSSTLSEPDYTKAFADSKAAAVAQFSYEYAEGYSSGFALAPKSAILNFTITGLTASTDVNVVLTGGGEINFNKTVTTDGSGNATFAIGVDHYSYLENFSLTVGGKAITLGSKTLEAGKIYNITRSVRALSEATTDDIGKIAGADGKIYDNATAAKKAGTTAVAMIAYKSETAGESLAIQLNASPASMDWSAAKTYASGLTAVPGGTWRLPSMADWQNMFVGCAKSGDAGAGNTMDPIAGFKEKIGATGITWKSDRYWSSTDSGSVAWSVIVNLDDSPAYASFGEGDTSSPCCVLGCLAF